MVTQDAMMWWMAVGGSVCWGICFGWMHRISRRQDRLLEELRAQGKRIEKLSQVEHDLIREVHPQVGEIKHSMEVMMDAVTAAHTPQPPQSS